MSERTPFHKPDETKDDAPTLEAVLADRDGWKQIAHNYWLEIQALRAELARRV